jgi:hypothetical protein
MIAFVPVISVRMTRRGFRGHMAQFRIAWSAVGPLGDFRASDARWAVERRLAGVSYVSGASARDAAIWRAELLLVAAGDRLLVDPPAEISVSDLLVHRVAA